MRLWGRGGSLLFLLSIPLWGCSTDKDVEKINRDQSVTIQGMAREIQRLNDQLDVLMQSRQDLAHAKTELEEKLRTEMEAGDLSISMQDRGLVVTVLDRVLFDSGQAELRDSAKQTLDKVASVLNREMKEKMIYVEGHTDDRPIRFSNWRSNWELAGARALEVVHHFVEVSGLVPERIAATAYGEFHPVAENRTEAGRMKNRRVEIVISPKKYGG